MKLRNVLLTGCILAGLGITACDKDDDNSTTLNTADTDFMTKASISNSAEDSAATIANSRGTNASLKTFAQMMLMEHTTAQVDLKSLGSSVGYAIKDTLDPLHKLKGDTLKTLAVGRRFDSVYIWNQVIDHQTTITNFQTHRSNGQHQSVKNYNTNYLPKIQMHFNMADTIARKYFPR